MNTPSYVWVDLQNMKKSENRSGNPISKTRGTFRIGIQLDSNQIITQPTSNFTIMRKHLLAHIILAFANGQVTYSDQNQVKEVNLQNFGINCDGNSDPDSFVFLRLTQNPNVYVTAHPIQTVRCNNRFVNNWDYTKLSEKFEDIDYSLLTNTHNPTGLLSAVTIASLQSASHYYHTSTELILLENMNLLSNDLYKPIEEREEINTIVTSSVMLESGIPEGTAKFTKANHRIEAAARAAQTAQGTYYDIDIKNNSNLKNISAELETMIAFEHLNKCASNATHVLKKNTANVQLFIHAALYSQVFNGRLCKLKFIENLEIRGNSDVFIDLVVDYEDHLSIFQYQELRKSNSPGKLSRFLQLKATVYDTMDVENEPVINPFNADVNTNAKAPGETAQEKISRLTIAMDSMQKVIALKKSMDYNTEDDVTTLISLTAQISEACNEMNK